jgi:hypothetical protein
MAETAFPVFDRVPVYFWLRRSNFSYTLVSFDNIERPVAEVKFNNGGWMWEAHRRTENPDRQYDSSEPGVRYASKEEAMRLAEAFSCPGYALSQSNA